MLYSYSFINRKRDLSDILSDVVSAEPRFISNFKVVPCAHSTKHEWLEDHLTGRGITATRCQNSVLTVSTADAAKVRVGMLLTLQNDPALFRITVINGTSVTVALAAANGSSTTSAALPAAGGKFLIVSSPMGEGTVNGDGEESYTASSVNYNCTQIFRKEIVLSGTAMALHLYGSADNQINRQTAFALSELARDLNRVALFGRRVENADGTKGEAGGLYYFAAGNGLEIDANQHKLDSFLINDAAQKIMAEGGEPTQILVNPGQARVLSNEFKDRLRILRSDRRRGAFVAAVINEINGRELTIMADPDVPETDAWLLDTAGFGLANLSGRIIQDADATPKGFDGVRRVAMGELTFEFKNAAQRCCRIKNLLAPAAALTAYRNGTPVQVVNSQDNPLYAQVVSGGVSVSNTPENPLYTSSVEQ